MMAESGQNCRHLHGKVGFSGGSADKESACNVGDLRSIPELGRSPGEGKGCPPEYSGLENYQLYSPWGHKESDKIKSLSLSILYLF